MIVRERQTVTSLRSTIFGLAEFRPEAWRSSDRWWPDARFSGASSSKAWGWWPHQSGLSKTTRDF